MKEYLIYSFYNEVHNFIAIIREDTPEEVIEQFKQKYDEVKYKE